MAWKNETYDAARLAAERYYDEVLSKGIFPGQLRRLPADRDEAIEALADRNVQKIREHFPEKSWDASAAKKLGSYDAGQLEKWLYEYGDDPITAAKKTEFTEYQKLIAPPEGERSWLDMPAGELQIRMRKFGFDPGRKGDFEQFINTLAEHQLNYDRGQIVKQEVTDAPIYNKIGMVAYPTLTEEAIRQSLTGDFSDARKWGALVSDVGAQAMFTRNAASPYLMSSPFRIGAADALVEGGRQLANLGMGLEAQPLAPVGAGVAAGLAPAGANYIARILSRGKTNDARPFVRGFRRGVRGADDDLTIERNSLSETLGKAWDQSRAAQEGGQVTNSGISGSIEAGAYSDAEKALRVLGYRSRAEEQRLANNVQAAQARLDEMQPKSLLDRYNKKPQPRVVDDGLPAPAAPAAQAEEELPEILRPKVEYEAPAPLSQVAATAEDDMPTLLRVPGRQKPKAAPAPKFVAPKQYTKEEVNAAKNDLKRALAEQQAYEKSIPKYEGNVEPKYIEDVIGPNPDNVVAGYGAYAMPNKKTAIEKVLKEDYDQPVQFLRNTSGPSFHKETAPERNALRDMFKAKFEKELATGQSKKRMRAYNSGVGAGSFANQILTVVEPTMKVNPFAPQEYDTRLRNFTETKWFKSLPKEKKNAVERALKGE